MRIDGRLRKLQAPTLTNRRHRAHGGRGSAGTPRSAEEFDETNEADFAYSMPGVGRFRVNAFRARGSAGLVFRRVSVGAIGLDDLGPAAGGLGVGDGAARSGARDRPYRFG